MLNSGFMEADAYAELLEKSGSGGNQKEEKWIDRANSYGGGGKKRKFGGGSGGGSKPAKRQKK